MSAPEVSLSAFFKPYLKYWWVVIVVFIAAALFGLLLPPVFRHDVYTAEFSLPIVVRKQYSPNWKGTDEDALISFVIAYLRNEWREAGDITFPDAEFSVVIQKDTYYFYIEQEAPFEDDDVAVIEGLASQIDQNFHDTFIKSSESPWWEFIQNEGCLTDTDNVANVVCFPISEELQTSDQDSYALAKLLWVGERSPVTAYIKLPYARVIRSAVSGGLAVCVLLIALLVLMSRKEP